MSRRAGGLWSFLRRGLVAMLLAQLAVIAGLVGIDSWRKRVRPRSNVFPRSAPAEVPVRDSVATIYTYGEDVYADMLAAIRGAERRVLFE
jgi:cardiolipin synthase